MSTASQRLLIVNADDFGLTAGVNRGIIEAHRDGIVTSASLMVRAPAARDAAALARANRRLGLGLHVDLGEWTQREGEWTARYERVAEGDAAAAAAELDAQLALFEEMTGHAPDHLDSHQHVHLSRPEVAQAVERVAARLGIGVRERDPRVKYRGMYGEGAITPVAYIVAIRNLAAGATEFGCHPGHVEGLESAYSSEREVEVRTLCDRSVRAAVSDSGVRLITWAELPLH